MAIPDISGIATAAAAVISAAALTMDGNALKVYATEPREFDRLPACAIRFEGFRRRGVNEPDVQLGGNEWELTYAISLAVPMDDPQRAQNNLVALTGPIIDAIDTSGTLGRIDVQDAVCEDGTQEFTDDQDQQQMAFMFIRLAVTALSTT